jgi:hypothetical protein
MLACCGRQGKRQKDRSGSSTGKLPRRGGGTVPPALAPKEILIIPLTHPQ